MKFCTVPLALLVLLSGCKVGPNYTEPDPPMPFVYTEDRPNQTTAVADEELVTWWAIFDDPFLDQLMDEALCGSFDYRIALERISQARALYWVQFTQILPEFDADALGTRFRTSQSFASGTAAANTPAAASAAAAASTGLSPIRDFFQAGLGCIWEIDLFGGLRRSAEASYDTLEATVADARGVKIMILSEVANIYASICALQKKIDIYSQITDLDQELLKLSTNRFESGLADAQEVDSYTAEFNTDHAAMIALQTSLRQSIYSLGILLGREPEKLLADFDTQRPIPYAAGKVPAGLPSDLLRRRPDINAAERQLASATEQIGVAVADLFPRVSLAGSSSSFAANPLQGANVGYSSDNITKLFTPASRIWGYGLFITFPVLDFGKRLATVDAQVSAARQAYLSYQKTVVAALQETEQALVAYFNEEDRQENLNRATQSNYRNLELDTDLFQSGLGNYTQVLEAKETWLISANALIDSKLALATDLVAIYKALGGDW